MLSKNDSKYREKISESDHVMDVTKYVAIPKQTEELVFGPPENGRCEGGGAAHIRRYLQAAATKQMPFSGGMENQFFSLFGYTFSRVIFFVVTALVTFSCPAFCVSQSGMNEELIDKQYKSHINEFHSVFGRQMEREFNLKWVEGGFLHNFSSNEPEFYAYRRVTFEEARALVLAVMNKLADAVRADPIMLAYLNGLSLTPDSMGVNICFVNSSNYGYGDGSIDSVYSYHSNRGPNGVKKLYLHYTTIDPFSDVSDHDTEVYSSVDESFEDAVTRAAAASIKNPAIHESTGFENELDQILTSFKEEMKEKHGLLFRTTGWMTSGKSTSVMEEIRTKCMYRYRVDCQEARALILLAAEKLLTVLNNSETLRPYLKDHSFSASQLKLRILFIKENYFVGDAPYYDGSMESAVLSGNTITYYHHIPNTKDPSMHDRVVYDKESYQEAQETFESTPPLTLSKKIIKGVNYLTFNLNRLFEFSVFIFFTTLLFIICMPQILFFVIPLIIVVILNWRRRPSQES